MYQFPSSPNISHSTPLNSIATTLESVEGLFLTFKVSPVTFNVVAAFDIVEIVIKHTAVSIKITNIFLKFFIKRTLLFSTNITINFVLWYVYSI